MKNFFKKLAFVLALAMVVTSVAPALSANAATGNYIKVSGDSTTYKSKSSVTMFVGENHTMKAYVNGKATDGTWTTTDKKYIKLSKSGVIKPQKGNGSKVGTAVVTFTSANKKTKMTLNVKVGNRAKTVKLYNTDANDVKTGEALKTLDLKVGESTTIWTAMSAAAKGSSATYNSYVKVYTDAECTKEATDDSILVADYTNRRKTEVTAKNPGTVYIKAVADQSSKLSDKAVSSQVVAVTVKPDFGAAQTGGNTIKVTGNNLTNVVEDYVVKRGTITTSIKEVKLNEAKTEATLVAASSNLITGDYTLSFQKGEAIAFKVEAAKVDKIEITTEKAIMDAADPTKATAQYKVYNQFGEDITSNALASNVTVNGSDSASKKSAGVVSFTNSAKYTANLSQVSLTIVNTDNGVYQSAVLTVGEASKLTSIEYAGVFKSENGAYKKAVPAEGETTVSNYYVAFKGLDQYGLAYNSTSPASIQLNLSSVTGLGVGALTTITSDNVTYLAFPLQFNNSSVTKVSAGEVTLLAIVLTSGQNLKDTFTVIPSVKVTGLTVSDAYGVYGGQANELYFEAFDSDGKAVTDYTTLSRLNNTTNMPNYTSTKKNGVAFERKADGSAKLVYYANDNKSSVSQPTVLSFISEDNQYKVANINIQPNCVPKAIIGIDKDVSVGFVRGTTSSAVIARKDLIFEDQYGNVMADDATALDSIKIATTVSDNNLQFTGLTSNATGTALTTSGAVLIDNAVTATAGSVTVGLSILDANGKVNGSDYSFTLYNVDIDNVTNFAIDDIGLTEHNTVITPVVKGSYNGKTVKLPTGTYEVISTTPGSLTTTAPTISGTDVVTKEGTLSVLVFNKVGTEVAKKYEYSNAKAVISSAKFVDGFTSLEVASNGSVTVASAAGVLETKTQYGVAVTNEAIRVTFSNLPTGATVTNNGQSTATVSKLPNGYTVLRVKYSFANGFIHEADLLVEVK